VETAVAPEREVAAPNPKRATLPALESAWVRVPLAVAVALWPALLVSGLVKVFLHATIFNFTPSITDEVDYWHEANTLLTTGLNSGYYTFNEIPGRISFLHFGAHGPFFIVLEALVGKVAGWQPYTGAAANLVVVTIAVALFIVLTRPSTWRLVALGIVLSCTWPLLVYLPTNMEEPFQDAIAIVVAGLFVLLFRAREPSRRVAIPLICLLALVSLVRPTWSLLILPAVLLGWRPRTWPWRTAAVLGSLAAVAVLTYVFSATAAPPYPQRIALYTRLVDAITAHGPAGILDFVSAALRNLWTFVIPSRLEDPLVTVQRAQVVVILAAYLVFGVLALRRKSGGSEALFQLWNLGSILSAVVTFNFVGDWVDWQVIAPQLILSVVLLVGLGNRDWLVALFVISSLLVGRTFVHDFIQFRAPQFQYSQAQLTEFRDAVKPWLVYQPNQGPWCNTLLLAENYPPEMIEVPPGIGISIMLGDEMKLPPRSHYLLLDGATYQRLQGSLNVRPLASTVRGELYENLDAGCPAAG